MALSKEYRLPLRHERERLDKEGKSLHSSLFTIILVSSPPGILIPRFAILVSKKIHNLAVHRNHLKRQILGIIQRILVTIPTADYLIITKKAALNKTSTVLQADISRLLQK